ncbi:MAG: ABC transporter ATP-binding protein/permease [Planctomycetaceae bacterium]|jgi:ATP-binding cassette subfamily B protein/subfamily B ATP-binding cassette protein MsbA|nr:ABC transporter ATP-binding protein/permease [Planctomycetaceae bacterium]
MSNLYRAVQRTFRFPLLIAFTVFCALAVGILWGGNIGAVAYPMAEICIYGRSTVSEIIEKNIEKEQNHLFELKQPDSVNQKILWLQWAKRLADKYTPNTMFGTVVFLMAVILAGTVVKSMFVILHSLLSAKIAQIAAMEIRDEFFQKVLHYETAYFNREGIADTMSRFTNDMYSLTAGLNVLYGKIVREPLKMFVCLAGAAYVSWQLLLITLLFVPAAAVAIRWLAKSIKRVVRRSMEEMSNMFGQLEETFRSIRVVKSFTQEDYEQEKFRKISEAYCKRAVKIAKYESLTNPLTELFGILMICAAIVTGAYLVMEQQTAIFGLPMSSEPLTLPSLFLFFSLLAGAADPARKLSDIFTAFQSAAAAADRIYAKIDRDVPIKDPVNPVPLPVHKKSLRFDNVSFHYESERPVLKNVSLEIKFGECIAVLGASGCGKSTLLNLIPRFYDPAAGQVLLDNVPLNTVSLSALRQQIGLVTQEPVLFNDTVLNNIRYGKPSANEIECIAAAKQAFAHQFIMEELTDGYATLVGPAGGQLSGGQRQRIALARAILRNPPIFLLDEATSQIDINSEKMIHEALAAFKQGRTTVMITHRLTALPLADRIVMMNDGKITAVGTHGELLQTTPEYARLF